MIALYLVVESAHVQGGVSRGILGAHVGPVEQQVLQVLHVAVAAGLQTTHTHNSSQQKDGEASSLSV